MDIGDYCFHLFKFLTVNEIPSLKALYLGDYCFDDIHQFYLLKLEELETVQIGRYSFMDNSHKKHNDDLFHISCCPKLRELIIEEMSFHSYSTMKLENLEALEHIFLGKHCFEFADLSLQGM